MISLTTNEKTLLGETRDDATNAGRVPSGAPLDPSHFDVSAFI